VVTTAPGVRVRVHVPVDGKPLNTTLPVAIRQVACVIVPFTGAAGLARTVIVQVALAAEQREPNGLLVVTVITTFFPRSPLAGVYVNENGEVFAEAGVTEPLPFRVIVTNVALPPKVFPAIVIIVNPQVLTVVLLRVTVGGLTHCPKASKEIITKKVIHRKTLVIFHKIRSIEYTTILRYNGSTIAKING
jgi:hypothetical protein